MPTGSISTAPTAFKRRCAGRVPGAAGQFEEISWEEAYREIAARLKQLKAAYGPESVLFYSGYAKWYRSFLQRLAHSFGSPNFGSESSTCHMATVEAWKDMVGTFSAYDVQNAATFMAWAVNPYHSKPTQLRQLYEVKERGQKIVVIDPRVTPMTTKLADLHLRIRPGTDGALALGMGKLIIDNGWWIGIMWSTMSTGSRHTPATSGSLT